MFKHLFSQILFLSFLSVNALAQDSLRTYYEDKTFHTYYQTEVNASHQVSDTMIDDFIGQFRGDPELLFEWALTGLGVQDDAEKDGIVLVLKKTIFEPKTSIGHILCDIKVPGLRTFKDIDIKSCVTKNQLSSGSTQVIVDIFYSNILLKKAYGEFYIHPLSKEKQLFSILTKVQFNWFFDLFITTKKYRNIFEFRAKGFVDNLKHEAERRQINLSSPKKLALPDQKTAD